jgi:hypothetical protein
MTPFKMVYGKLCHLPVELEHKAYWAIRALYFNMKSAEENVMLYKEKKMLWHDKMILRRAFQVGELVFLFNSRLKLFSGKLRSRWTGPYQVQKIFDHGAVEIWSERTGAFTLNGHIVKHYRRDEPFEEGVNVSLSNAPSN